MITQFLHDIGDQKEFRVVLDSQMPHEQRVTSVDKNGLAAYEIHISCRKLGQDNGKDQLISISDYLKQIRDYIREVSRELTVEELQKLKDIIKTPYGQ